MAYRLVENKGDSVAVPQRVIATLPELAEHLKALARPGDLILTVGAGDIYTVGEELTGPEI